MDGKSSQIVFLFIREVAISECATSTGTNQFPSTRFVADIGHYKIITMETSAPRFQFGSLPLNHQEFKPS